MQNWYCLVNFPDETQSVHLVPGPAPIGNHPVVKLVGKPGFWVVQDITARVSRPDNIAAELWVRPATDEELTSLSGAAGETAG